MDVNIDLFRANIPEYIIRAADILISNGYKAYLVCGALRDIILDKIPKDYDLATSAFPSEIEEIFPKTVMTNSKFGTVLAIVSDEQGEPHDIEITTFRKEEEYVMGRWPTHIEFTRDIENDLARRDFTINSFALNLRDLWDQGANFSEVFLDPFNGLEDLRNKLIRAVRDPNERLQEDGLRSFRACRFASELDFTIEKETFIAIQNNLAIAKQVSIERIRDEFLKMLYYSPKPSKGIELMRKTGLLEIFIPELIQNIGVDQPEWHVDDSYNHALKVVDLSEDSIKVAALLHDIGKAKTISKDEKGTHFYGHDKQGAEIAEEILKRLKFPKNEIKRIKSLIRWHMFYYPSAEWRKEKPLEEYQGKPEESKNVGGWSDAAVRRFIKNVGGEEIIDDLFKLRIADATANPKSQFDPVEIKALEKRIAKVRAEDMALKVTDLSIDGNDLIKVGIKKGPRIGQVLGDLLDQVIEDPSLNTKEKLLELAKEIINNKL